MWNRAFEEAQVIEYPEKLKAALVAIRPFVDITLPGLEPSNGVSGAKQPSFIESQENDSRRPRPTPRVLTATPKLTRSSSKRSSPATSARSLGTKSHSKEKTPDVSRPGSARRATTPRLRHDDSQIQFAAIESSSPGQAFESQVLTDHQQEVRERQKDNAALFPDLQSSGQKRKRSESAKLPKVPGQVEEEKATTPKSHRSYEDYVSLTPTPRRGQAPALEDNDHEMTDDIPSSPPEPRRYPLVPEISKPQSSIPAGGRPRRSLK